MAWCAVHVVVAFRRVDRKGKVGINESIYLMDGQDSDDIERKAKSILSDHLTPDETLTIDGHKSEVFLAKIRKIVSIVNPVPMAMNDERPVEGSEIGYLTYELKRESDLEDLLNGEAINIFYYE